MDSEKQLTNVEQVGEVAGQVWMALASVESISIAKLIRLVSAPRDTTMQAVGWLAREGKIEIHEANRGRTINLTPHEKGIAAEHVVSEPWAEAA